MKAELQQQWKLLDLQKLDTRLDQIDHRLANLPQAVCAALGGGACREERVFVRAQPEVRYEQFMEVMNSMQANGFFKVGLLNEDIE